MKVPGRPASSAPDLDSPGAQRARILAREWFLLNPGAPAADFHTWIVEEFEPDLCAGYGWPSPVPLPRRTLRLIRHALDEAHDGLTAALDQETRARRTREMARSGHQRPAEPPERANATVRVSHWWSGAQKGGAA